MQPTGVRPKLVHLQGQLYISVQRYTAAVDGMLKVQALMQHAML